MLTAVQREVLPMGRRTEFKIGLVDVDFEQTLERTAKDRGLLAKCNKGNIICIRPPVSIFPFRGTYVSKGSNTLVIGSGGMPFGIILFYLAGLTAIMIVMLFSRNILSFEIIVIWLLILLFVVGIFKIADLRLEKSKKENEFIKLFRFMELYYPFKQINKTQESKQN